MSKQSNERLNTDRELWREQSEADGDPDNYYAPSIHVTASGGIGINVGGSVIVLPLREWHKLALPPSMRSHPCADVVDRAARAIAKRLDITPWDRLPWGEQRAYLDTAKDAIAALTPAPADETPPQVNGGASEPPLLSERLLNAGGDHAPDSAAREGSEAPADDAPTPSSEVSEVVERGLLSSLRAFVAEHARGVGHDMGDAVILIDAAADLITTQQSRISIGHERRNTF